MSDQTALTWLINDLAVYLEPMVPKLFGQPVIDLKKELNKNREKILAWLIKNKHLINQL